MIIFTKDFWVENSGLLINDIIVNSFARMNIFFVKHFCNQFKQQQEKDTDNDKNTHIKKY